MAEFSLYSYFRSSASFRVRIGLNLKQIPFEYKPIHLIKDGGIQNTESYKELNPSKQVPTLVHEGKVIGQSVAILEYLDAVKPEKPLFPKDPFAHAQVLQICEIVNSGTQPYVNLNVLQHLEKSYGFDQAKKDEWAAHWCRLGFESLERILQKTAGKYAFGDTVTAADCFVIPQTFTAKRFHVDANDYPLVGRIAKTCLELPEFIAASPDKQPDYQP